MGGCIICDPSKSQICLDGAHKMVSYYTLVGHPVEPANMMWLVIQNFIEQWKALKEKKKSKLGLPPCLNKDKLIYKWLKQLNQILTDKIGVQNAPFTYLICPDAQPPALLVASTANQPYSVDYELIEHEMRICALQDHTIYKLDNSSLFQIIEHATAGHDVSATIALYCCAQNGREDYQGIASQHASMAVCDQNAKDATTVLTTRTWTGTTSTMLLQHMSMHCMAYIQACPH